jgi:hypothetical protein
LREDLESEHAECAYKDPEREEPSWSEEPSEEEADVAMGNLTL